MFRILATCYLLLVTCLFLYSYTQVDLNLTLSELSIWQVIQKSFQQIGWFARPLSTAIYITLLLLLSIFYIFILKLVQKNNITIRQFWQLVIPVSVILLFSYNAFSYDLFNYMFDARIVTYHNLNPYEYKALDFPKDPWIHFMRWTHRTYPYGPVWLWLTVPLSFIGMQVFLPTMFLFKGLMVLGYLASVYFIWKIAQKVSAQNSLFAAAFFAFHPLVLIEGLVSAHHDIVMMGLALASLYYLLEKKYIVAFFLLALSAGLKFATAFLVPIFLFVLYLQFSIKEVHYRNIFLAATIFMVPAVIFSILRTELQPWYFLWVLPFVALTRSLWLMSGVAVFSIGLLFHYTPFIYTGNWDPPIPTIKLWISLAAGLTGVILASISLVGKKPSF